MLNKTRKWSEPNDCDGSTCTSCMKDVLESTISKIFPLICVGESTNWTKLWSNIRSQKQVERGDVPVSVLQLVSGRLKSPTIITCSEEEVNSAR